MYKRLLYYTFGGIVFTAVTGTLFHFIYEWSGENFYVGLFAPVNESVWEHMKLIFFPALVYFIFENRHLKNAFPCIGCSNAAALLTGTFSIPVIFYTYSGILGTNYPILDISIFYVSDILTFTLSYKLAKRKIDSIHCRWLEAAVLLIAVCFMVFTVYPPDFGLFQIP